MRATQSKHLYMRTAVHTPPDDVTSLASHKDAKTLVVKFLQLHLVIKIISLHQNTGQRPTVLLMRLCHL